MTNENNNQSVYELTPYEERVLTTLEKAKRKLTTQQVAKFSKISYNATSFNLKKLHKKNKVKFEKGTNKTYWEVNQDQ